MYPRAFLEQLLTLLESRGHLGPRARVRVTALINQGIHPEQIFVGGGIVSPEVYRSYLVELTGMQMDAEEQKTPSMQLPPGFTRELIQRQRVLPLGETPAGWRIGYVQPWDQSTRARVEALAVAHAWQAIPVVLLKAEWNRQAPWQETHQAPHIRTARTSHAVFQDGQSMETWYLDPQHPRSDLHKDTRVRQVTVPSAYLPALGRRLRRSVSTEARLSLRPLGQGMALRVQQVPSEELDHPSNWFQSPLHAKAHAPGLSVFIGTDPLFRYILRDSVKPSSVDIDQWREEEVLSLTVPERADRELLTHALMAGKAATVHVAHPGERWWEALAEAGIPVRVIHKQVLPEGESWVSYEL